MFGPTSLAGDLVALQSRLGVPTTDAWDLPTLSAVATYQGRGSEPLEMHVTGVPDPATLVNLGYYDPTEELPRRYAQYLAGDADPPTTFWRDTATLSNQVPRWVWLLAAAGLLGVGYYAYRRNQRQEQS